MTFHDSTGGHVGQIRFWNPGPVWVRPDVAAAQQLPMMSHRSKDFVALYEPVLAALPRLFRGPQAHTFTMTGSATAAMEGALRSLFGLRGGKILVTTAGAFAERFAVVAESCGLTVERLDFGWGGVVDPARVAAAIRAGGHDALAVVHNETSTGSIHPLAEIARAARDVRPEIFLLADAVTSLGGAPLEFDTWGLDVAFAGSQKALALPPGLAVVAISERALARAKATPGRGTYLDFVELVDFAESRKMTPATPALQLLAALAMQLVEIEKETLEGRWARHAALRDRSLARLLPAGFSLVPPRAAASPTVSCLRPPTGISGTDFTTRLKKRGVVPGSGYGSLKDTTFRIGHMGDVDLASLDHFLDACLDAARAA